MLAYVSPQNAALLEGIREKMSKTPTTMEKVIAGLKNYTCGSELTILSVDDGRERTVEIEFLQDVIMIQGDRRLKLHVNDAGSRFMCFVYMDDVMKGKDWVRVTMRSCHHERLFDNLTELSADVALAAQAN